MADTDKEFEFNISSKVDLGDANLHSSSGKRKIFSRETPEAIAASWVNGFTDPSEHSEDRFRYLVHGFQGQTVDVLQMLYVIEGMKRGEGQNIGEKIDLLM